MGKNFVNDYLKAVHKQNREEEIEMFGKPIKHNRIQQSKKQFKRTKFKYKSEEDQKKIKIYKK